MSNSNNQSKAAGCQAKDLKVETLCQGEIPMPALCGARTRANRSCRQKSMPNGRCRLHGGLTPTGVAHGAFKHGRYSKYLPTKLGEKYAESLADPNLTELRDEIALVDLHLAERLAQLHAGESRGKWESVLKLVTELGKADDISKVAKIRGKLEEVVTKGVYAFVVYDQIESMIEQRRKLVESEAKRMKDLGQNIPVEKAVGMVARLASIVKRHVTDPSQLNAISREFAEITQ